MRLYDGNDNDFENADLKHIEKVISELENAEQPFAVLMKSDDWFMQTACVEENGFSLEYCEGSLDKQFVSEEILSAEDVIKVFGEYLQGTDDYKKRYNWQVLALNAVLFSGDEKYIENPEAADIESVVHGLSELEEPFAVLKFSDEHFMQTLWEGEEGFILECCDKSDKKFYAAEEMLSEKQVIEAFYEFLNGEQDYKDRYTWVEIEEGLLLYDGAENSYENPGLEEIKKIIYGLSKIDEPYAVLEQSENCFIQAAMEKENGFVLEYREGDEEEHLFAQETLSADEVVAAFSEFSQGIDDFKKRYTWNVM